MPIEQLEDPRQGNAATVFALRQRADGGLAVAQRDGFVVDVEGEQDRNIGPVWPCIWLQASSGTHRGHRLRHPLVAPPPASDDFFRRLLLWLPSACREQQHHRDPRVEPLSPINIDHLVGPPHVLKISSATAGSRIQATASGSPLAKDRDDLIAMIRSGRPAIPPASASAGLGSVERHHPLGPLQHLLTSRR